MLGALDDILPQKKYNPVHDFKKLRTQEIKQERHKVTVNLLNATLIFKEWYNIGSMIL